jgi:hypothetical protein
LNLELTPAERLQQAEAADRNLAAIRDAGLAAVG